MEDENLENTKTKAKDLLRCGLCYQTYDDPRLLPCSHSFCRRCLQLYHDSIAHESSIRLGSFHCPTCKALIGIPPGGVSDFPFDRRIGEIKETAVREMQDILLKKLLARRGMSDAESSIDSSDTESQSSDIFNQGQTSSHETDPPIHQGKSRSFGRFQTFTAFDSRQKPSASCDAPLSRSGFSHRGAMYSSLREVHRRKAQDLLAAFDKQAGFSETVDCPSRSSPSRDNYYYKTTGGSCHRRDKQGTNDPSDDESVNSSSCFKEYRAEDESHGVSSTDARSSFVSSKSAKTTSDSAELFSNVSSASGYSDDKGKMFPRKHWGYQSLRVKGSRRTYLEDDDTSSFYTNKTAGESKFQETGLNFGDVYRRCKPETDARSVPVPERGSYFETVAGLQTVSENQSESVSDRSCLNRAKNDLVDLENLGYDNLTYIERPAETVSRLTDNYVNDQNGETHESVSKSQTPYRKKENFVRLKKHSSGRTKLSGVFFSSLATAHEECVPGDKASFGENAASEEDGNSSRCSPNSVNTLIPNTSIPVDVASKSHSSKPVRNEKRALSQTSDKMADVSGEVPLKNSNVLLSLEEEGEVMREFDFLLEHLNEDEGFDRDGERNDGTPSLSCASSETYLPEHRNKMSCTTASSLLTDVSRQSSHDAEGTDSEGIADEPISKNGMPENGMPENGLSADHRGMDNNYLGNSKRAKSSSGIDECLPNCNDPLPDLYGNEKKPNGVASKKHSFRHPKEDRKRVCHQSSFDDNDYDDDDGDNDKVLDGKLFEEEGNNIEQSPHVLSPIIGDDVAAAGQSNGCSGVTHQKGTTNEGTATLRHVSPEEYLMPTGVAILSQGNTVVADYGVGCLQYYAEDGSPLHRIEGMKPFSIAVNPARNEVIVGDRRRKTVCLFDEYGCDVAQWDSNMFNWICGIGILRNGDLVILDREKSQIGIYKPDSQRVHTFGSYGNDACQLCMGEFLVVDGMDRIVVSDSGNHCVKVFSVSGTLLQKFGSRGCNDGEMQWPKGVCTDESNNIIVADTCNSRLSMFSSNGSFVQHVVTNITMPYAVSYCNPNVAVTRYSVMGQSQFLLYNLNNKS